MGSVDFQVPPDPSSLHPQVDWPVASKPQSIEVLRFKSSSLVVDGLSLAHGSATRSISIAVQRRGKMVKLITTDLGHALAL